MLPADGLATLEAYDLYCHELRLSRETAATYLTCVRQFLEWWEHESGLAQQRLSNPVAVAYATFLLALEQEEEITEGRRAVRLSAVRRWGTFLVSSGRLAANPFQKITGPDKPTDVLPACLSEDAVRSRLAAMPRGKLIELRDYVIALLMLRTGIRETELCEASVGDLLPVGELAFLQVQSKGKKKKEKLRESVVLRPDVYVAVQDYLTRREREEGPVPASGPLFTKDRAWRLRWEGIRPVGNERLTPDDIRRRLKPYFNFRLMSLRQTAAVHALMNGAPLDGVQEMMRHESLETTKLYKKIANRLQRGGERFLDHLAAASTGPSPSEEAATP